MSLGSQLWEWEAECVLVAVLTQLSWTYLIKAFWEPRGKHQTRSCLLQWWISWLVKLSTNSFNKANGFI